MITDKRLAAGLLALYLLCYIVPLGHRPLFVPDETRYAEVPREMLESGDWVSPRLNGLRYFEKPVFGYWLVAISEKLLGEDEFAVRLPGALAAGLGALAIYWLVRRAGGGARAALLAAGILLTCGGFFGVGTFIVLDMMLTAAVAAGLACFFVAHQEEKAARRAFYLALFGAACGVAFLTKGFVGLVIPCVTIAPFVFWQQFPEGLWPAVRGRQLSELTTAALAATGRLARLAVIPIIAAAAVALPWSVMIHLREPDFWHYFFWVEHVERATARNADHASPFWFFVPVLILGALPWSAFLPAAVAGMKGAELRSPLTRFLICWAVFPFLLFSVSSGKMATYILPCFPALAGLLALGLVRYLEAGGRRAFNLAALIPAGILLLAGAGLVVWRVADFSPRVFEPDETGKLLTACATLLAWAVCALMAVRAREVRPKLIWVMAVPLALFLAGPFMLPDEIEDRQGPNELLIRNRERIPPGSPVFSRPRLAHACAWYFKRQDIVLFDRVSEFEYGIANSPHPIARRVRAKRLARMVAAASPETLFTVVSEEKRFRELRPLLPAPCYLDSEGGNVLAQFKGGGGTACK